MRKYTRRVISAIDHENMTSKQKGMRWKKER